MDCWEKERHGSVIISVTGEIKGRGGRAVKKTYLVFSLMFETNSKEIYLLAKKQGPGCKDES